MFWVLLVGVIWLALKMPLPRSRGLLCDPTGGVATMAIMAAAGGLQAYGQYQQGKAQNSYYQYLAGQSLIEGQAAYDRSLKQSELIQDSASLQNKSAAIKAAEASSTQKAQMAASGVDLSSVSAQDITLDTLTKAKMDEMMIRRNANLNSWAVEEEGKNARWTSKNQADQYRFAGKQAKSAGKTQAFTTLLSTAATMALGAGQLGMFAANPAASVARATGSFAKAPLASNSVPLSFLRSVR